jgi:hypothetical protein
MLVDSSSEADRITVKTDQTMVEPSQTAVEAGPPLQVEAEQGESSDVKTEPAKSVALTANADFVVHGCQITRGRLDRLWDLVRDGFPADSYVSIEYTRHGKVESKLKSRSIDDLLTAISKSTLDENLDKLDNLWLYISHGNRTVHVRFRSKGDVLEEGVAVSVSGDEEWVHGRSSVLKEFLENTRSPLLMGRGYSRWVLGPLGFIVGLAVAIPPLNAYAQDKPLEFPLYLNAILLAGLIGIGSSIGILIDRQNGSRIILSKANGKGIDRVGLISLLISALTLAATVAAILVAHSDAIHGH